MRSRVYETVCCCGPMLGQTDGRTPYRFVDPAAHAMRAVPVRSTYLFFLCAHVPDGKSTAEEIPTKATDANFSSCLNNFRTNNRSNDGIRLKACIPNQYYSIFTPMVGPSRSLQLANRNWKRRAETPAVVNFQFQCLKKLAHTR